MAIATGQAAHYNAVCVGLADRNMNLRVFFELGYD